MDYDHNHSLLQCLLDYRVRERQTRTYTRKTREFIGHTCAAAEVVTTTLVQQIVAGFGQILTE